MSYHPHFPQYPPLSAILLWDLPTWWSFETPWRCRHQISHPLMTSPQPRRAARKWLSPIRSQLSRWCLSWVFWRMRKKEGAQGTVSFSCSPVGPKKSRVAGLYLDPAAMFPSYSPWLPPLALPKLSAVLSGERIQHPGQGTDRPCSKNSSFTGYSVPPFIPAS